MSQRSQPQTHTVPSRHSHSRTTIHNRGQHATSTAQRLLWNSGTAYARVACGHSTGPHIPCDTLLHTRRSSRPPATRRACHTRQVSHVPTQHHAQSVCTRTSRFSADTPTNATDSVFGRQPSEGEFTTTDPFGHAARKPSSSCCFLACASELAKLAAARVAHVAAHTSASTCQVGCSTRQWIAVTHLLARSPCRGQQSWPHSPFPVVRHAPGRRRT